MKNTKGKSDVADRERWSREGDWERAGVFAGRRGLGA